MEHYYVTLKIEGFTTLVVAKEEILNIGMTMNRAMDTSFNITSEYAEGELDINHYELVSISDCACD